MGRVDGKVALVTGAASGLGRGAAEILAREGAKVAVTDIDIEAGEAVARGIGEPAFFRSLDATVEADWRDGIADVCARFGRLDVLVNNAGVPTMELIEDTTLERWRSVMALNLDGVFLGVRAAIAAMKKTGGGSIINISSVAGLVGTPRTATYSASKAGVKLLTKCAALECAELGYNIRVNSIHPGLVETPMCEVVLREIGSGDAAAARKKFQQVHPIGRLGRIEDIACGVLYLASDESSFMTGAELIIDGGMTAQ